MRMYDLIMKKRKGEELTTEEINFFVDGFTKGEIPDYQASALLMAIFFNKMNKRETADLTNAMVESGDKIDLSNINGIKVDKHSTGGVGDKTSICLTPLVASLGIPVAKMSGRGLGHTGGTIDKLETFKGFSVELTEEEFMNNVNSINIAIMGQSGNLVPADKKLYALRDVTATVDNMSLIASSIMSKKLASGADAIVLDVKVGDGAFMKTPETAKELATEMVNIGNMLGRQTIGVISDMDQPLGYAIGNSLEVIEAIELLKGNGPKDLLELTLTLGSNMLLCAKKADTVEEARKLLLESIENGKGLEKLKEFVAAQGGDITPIDDYSKFPKAKYIEPVVAPRDGYITKIKAEAFGLIAMELGAGRATKESEIDLAVGIVLNKKRGEAVSKGDVLAYIHSNDISKIEKAKNSILEDIIIEDKYDLNIPLIYDIVR
ncbi:pyrimidine-nucleoside phosphorylase [Clostridium celatum]|uniref:Pyrimidine-nucleoside phosphorylase n=1 Tax=Clostridium celatum DSM 1785 TaxID=545697 RepID=L1QHF8_9CLOT|nr:pyrimidine-nucleoside phosphorylase [Clostridium celatum]EKY27027.1 pyrimidine-nucleoside phosphorylase [Clostridium celatum DSM 1785]MCE9654714.1 pyrimidine-nucleoside phosphorylase [Clostridium celatum]MDU3723742.1 pyrimidine-nucleoside phosphorylase [Clostridium celatum]MDU6295835.1 pyrimidine-nucleoside phosphorylase [Clostridium celatum]MDY3362099.1 pyrimidine-nucleoside phosphorylase [Clostridium celatum]